jgi:glutathione S-transferase
MKRYYAPGACSLSRYVRELARPPARRPAAGDAFSVADAYLFTVVKVREAMLAEGLIQETEKA